MSNEFNLQDNPKTRQYEVALAGSLARVEYIKAGDRIYLTHTEVPKALEGQGIAKRIVELVLQDVEKQQLSLIPLCPYVAAYVQRNPHWKKLLKKGVNV